MFGGKALKEKVKLSKVHIFYLEYLDSSKNLYEENEA